MPMPATVLGIFDKDNNELNYGEIGELCMTGPSIMLHYAGWMGEEMTERTLITHDDGKCWLHTGDIAFTSRKLVWFTFLDVDILNVSAAENYI